jgi:transcriptional regulator with XRE-family HTH domain
MTKALGRRIKGRRIGLGINQTDLARKVGRSHAWLSMVERGEGHPPAEVLRALAGELDEPAEDYLRLAGLHNEDGEILPRMATVTLSARELENLLARAVERGVSKVLEERGDRGG